MIHSYYLNNPIFSPLHTVTFPRLQMSDPVHSYSLIFLWHLCIHHSKPQQACGEINSWHFRCCFYLSTFCCSFPLSSPEIVWDYLNCWREDICYSFTKSTDLQFFCLYGDMQGLQDKNDFLYCIYNNLIIALQFSNISIEWEQGPTMS